MSSNVLWYSYAACKNIIDTIGISKLHGVMHIYNYSIMAANKVKRIHSPGIAPSSSVAVPFLIEAMRKSFSFTGNAQSHTTITCSFAVALLLYHPCQERNCIIILLIGSAREGSATLPLGLRGRKCLIGRHQMKYVCWFLASPLNW